MTQEGSVKLDELAVKCAESINASTAFGFSATDAKVLITTPAGWKAPVRFPRSEIIQVKEDGTRVRYLPAMRTLAWLVGFAGVADAEYRDGAGCLSKELPAPLREHAF